MKTRGFRQPGNSVCIKTPVFLKIPKTENTKIPGFQALYLQIASDSFVHQTNAGHSVIVWGTETLDCENCDGCPETTPSSIPCTGWLSVSYTENVDVSLAHSGMDDVYQALYASIGHPNARTGTRSASCGTASLPGCKMRSYSVFMFVTEGIEKRMNHQYQWRVRITHVPNASWFWCNTCGGSSLPPLESWHHGTWHPGGSSTAVGSSYQGAVATCEAGDLYDCP